MATISEIAGEYGIDTTNDADPFAGVEQATLNNLQTSLAELRSNSEELNAAKGFGRSTFHEAIQAKQEGDILGQTLVGLQQARSNDVLNRQQFERSVIGQGVAANIAETAAQNNLTRQQALDTSRASIAETAAQSDLTRQQTLDTSRAGLQETAAQSDFTRNTELIAKNTAAQKELNQQQGDIQSAAATLNAQLTKDIASYQAGLSEEAAGNAFTRQKDLIQKQFENGEISAQSAYERQSQLISQQAQYNIEQLQKDYELKAANLPEELRLKAEYEKSILVEQERLEEQKLQTELLWSAAGSAISAALGIVTSNTEGVTGSAYNPSNYA